MAKSKPTSGTKTSLNEGRTMAKVIKIKPKKTKEKDGN